jgi:hypothetical protein
MADVFRQERAAGRPAPRSRDDVLAQLPGEWPELEIAQIDQRLAQILPRQCVTLV